MLQVFEDGSAVLTFLFIQVIIPAWDSAGDTIRIVIGG